MESSAVVGRYTYIAVSVSIFAEVVCGGAIGGRLHVSVKNALVLEEPGGRFLGCEGYVVSKREVVLTQCPAVNDIRLGLIVHSQTMTHSMESIVEHCQQEKVAFTPPTCQFICRRWTRCDGIPSLTPFMGDSRD